MTTELELDLYIGKTMYKKRKELKMSRRELGELAHLSNQQIYKYERGINRVSASKLYEIAKVFGISILYFYKGAEEGRIFVNTKNNTVEVKLPDSFEINTKENDE